MREVATCKGHPRDVACAIWHPCQEEAFVSGDYDGNIFHWLLSRPGPQACSVPSLVAKQKKSLLLVTEAKVFWNKFAIICMWPRHAAVVWAVQLPFLNPEP